MDLKIAELKNQALTQEMEYLYTALHKIRVLAPFDKIYEVADTACTAYENNRKNNK